jgi:predicted YcjX-like family ATPase
VRLKFLRFEPPRRLERDAAGALILPQIRFDRALEFLIGDWLR